MEVVLATAQVKTEITQRKILEEAEREFSEKGLYGARVDSIASKAKVNKSLIYRHFGSKVGLYEEVLYRVYNRLGVLEDSVINASDDDAEKMKEFVRCYFNFLKENPSFVHMVMWENLNNAKYFKERGVAALKNPILAELAKIINRAKMNQTLPEGVDSDQLILTLIGCCFNYFSNMFTLNDIVGKDLMNDEYMEHRINSISDMLLSYLRLK